MPRTRPIEVSSHCASSPALPPAWSGVALLERAADTDARDAVDVDDDRHALTLGSCGRSGSMIAS